LLRSCQWDFVARLGPGAFRTISGEVVNTILLIMTQKHPTDAHFLHQLDASSQKSPDEKDMLLRSMSIQVASQKEQLANPDARVTSGSAHESILLKQYADSRYGLRTADSNRFIRCFWEAPCLLKGWTLHQSTVTTTEDYGGREHVILWQEGQGEIRHLADLGLASIQGGDAWKKQGIAVSLMSSLPVTRYTGELFDNNCAVIWPHNTQHLLPIWAFCSSAEFNISVRLIDQTLKVTNQTLLKVPFDLERWQSVADEAGPLPEPYSDDPTQWLFKGQPVISTAPLQVAVARLLGYSWPEQADDDLREFVNEDGIVPLPAMSGELAATERLRALLAHAYDDTWSHTKEEELLSAAEFAGKSLDLWLRDGYFKQHCRLFHSRPFIWHISDGRKDGFSALVNYHKLDARLLEKLTYTYVGDWIARQQESVRRNEGGADARLQAVKELQAKLKLILEGEPPYDIYVRWKQLHEQPIGWEPDLNDGVRLNIRPFMTADVLSSKPGIKWGIDRGKNPDSSARDNDVHLIRVAKQAAREAHVAVPGRIMTG